MMDVLINLIKTRLAHKAGNDMSFTQDYEHGCLDGQIAECRELLSFIADVEATLIKLEKEKAELAAKPSFGELLEMGYTQEEIYSGQAGEHNDRISKSSN